MENLWSSISFSTTSNCFLLSFPIVRGEQSGWKINKTRKNITKSFSNCNKQNNKKTEEKQVENRCTTMSYVLLTLLRDIRWAACTINKFNSHFGYRKFCCSNFLFLFPCSDDVFEFYRQKKKSSISHLNAHFHIFSRTIAKSVEDSSCSVKYRSSSDSEYNWHSSKFYCWASFVSFSSHDRFIEYLHTLNVGNSHSNFITSHQADNDIIIKISKISSTRWGSWWFGTKMLLWKLKRSPKNRNDF